MGDWSNETMWDEGAGGGTMSGHDPGLLDVETTALVRVAAAVARGGERRRPELEARLTAARAAGVPPLWIEELLLQSMLVVGYPLALVAFGVWRAVNGSPPAPESGAEALAHADWEAWAAR